MKFSWQNFDRKFLIEVIENSDKPESFKESARNCLDDKERLIGKLRFTKERRPRLESKWRNCQLNAFRLIPPHVMT